MKILFIGDKSFWSMKAGEYMMNFFDNPTIINWQRTEQYPRTMDEWQGDYILSFKSDLILTQTTLSRASQKKINFHPSPPRYRGVEGYRLALINNDKTFGVTCHYMIEKIDAGEIIDVHNFPIEPNESYESLKDKAGMHALEMLVKISEIIKNNKQLPKNNESWGKKLYTYAYFENIAK